MRRELLQVDMAYRCPLSWDDFPGNETHRHCGTCNHTVTNLSEMTTATAKEFLNDPKPGCVRFASNRDGTVQTKDQQSRWPRFLKPLKFLLAGLMYFVTVGCKPTTGVPVGNGPTVGKPAIPNQILGAPLPNKIEKCGTCLEMRDQQPAKNKDEK
jgi:hypothetical protein